MNEPLTAHELAHKLLSGPDLPVHIGYDYGDRSHRTAAPQVTTVTEAKVYYSEYISGDQACENNIASFVPDDARDVIILTDFNLSY